MSDTQPVLVSGGLIVHAPADGNSGSTELVHEIADRIARRWHNLPSRIQG